MEAPFAIPPPPCARPAAALCHAGDLLGTELVRGFGPDGFAAEERDSQIQCADLNLLFDARTQMHFDSRLPFIVTGFVGELSDLELAVELSIDSRKQVQVEGGSHA